MSGQRAEERLTDIAAFSQPGPGVTRLPYTPEHRAAIEIIRGWMAAAGLKPHLDNAGTLVGRSANASGKPILFLGSHQDSVRHGGRFDGIMGVALACLAVERLGPRIANLPFAIEVLAFADEEGVRFPTALVGPRALAGTFDPASLELTDRDGKRMDDAMRDFGLDPAAIPTLRRNPRDIAGYLECHIEQGPVLERAGLPVGIVTAICGITRSAVTFTGETGHAGTVPMAGRRDALVAAAEFVGAINAKARQEKDLRATIGQLELHPNVVNAIPAQARLTLEVRAPQDEDRARFVAWAQGRAAEIAKTHGTECGVRVTYAQPAVACDRGLREALASGIAAEGLTVMQLPSGATHDASAMADLCPVAMLFVRCRDGISHRPDEFASSEDMERATACLVNAIEALV